MTALYTTLAILLLLAGLLFWAVRKGGEGARLKQFERDSAARDIRDQVQNDVGALPPDAVRSELAKRSRK